MKKNQVLTQILIKKLLLTLKYNQYKKMTSFLKSLKFYLVGNIEDKKPPNYKIFLEN